MKHFRRLVLPALIASALASTGVWAQEEDCEELEGTPPGLYATTDEGTTFLIGKDGEIVELPSGSSGFADEDKAKCVKKPPAFLNWPCATQAAQSRMFDTYKIDDLETANKLKEIVERYFEIPEVLIPIPSWIDGEYNAPFGYNDLVQFSSPEYWYHPNADLPILSGKRPRSLLVSLFVGTNQVVLDNNMIDALRKELGSGDIPVTFVFNDSNTVPISYFGANVSLEEVFEAFTKRGIKVADVPMWWQGDYQLMPTIEEFDKFFEIKALDDIPADRQAAIRADIEANGFTRKSVIVSVFSEAGTMAVDQPDRIRVAASLGIKRIPTVFNFIEPDLHLARCGPGTPVGSSAVSGSSTPIGGASIPPTATGTPIPEPEEPASQSQTTGSSG